MMRGTTAAMSMTSLSTKSRRPEDIIIEGWLHKKGEHIRNWRPRYFILFHDGALLGFKAKPKLGQPFPEPLNDFMVKDAQVNSTSYRSPFIFDTDHEELWKIESVLKLAVKSGKL
ncbi:unnamed protein product [Heligmosomoides polygyrus]|uniref:PH domain-containing protein n=1 Tax=Heligmosomoides polygyrus TaxID=6339 RepID=A0A183G1S2_HELPZ|nr:unnamed protein product [Heligmosomoides polygyrus]